METYIEQCAPFKSTRNAKNLLGLRVLTSSGEVLGKVIEVRLDHAACTLEGVVVKRGMTSKLYLCKRYIEKITNDAVLLSIEPAVMLLGRKVITSDGKVLGTVKLIHRQEHKNDITSMVVKRPFFRKVTLPISHVKKLGSSIILKKSYDEVRKRGA